MKKRTRRLIILLVPIAVVGAGIALIDLVVLDRMSTLLLPYEYTQNVGPVFRAELPDIYHFLVEQEGYHASHLRVQHALAGHWARLTLERDDDALIDRETARAGLQRQFAEHEWQTAKDVQVVQGFDDKCFEPNPNQLTPEDLIYSHPLLPEGRWKHVAVFNCRVFVSDDGSKVVAYCHMSW